MASIGQQAGLFACGLAWLGLAAWASGHAILTKREVKSALSWTGVVWLLPILGPVLYFLVGINRVQRRADRLRRLGGRLREGVATSCPPDPLAIELPPGSEHLEALAQLVSRVTELPLANGNRVEVLVNGDVAYPRMLAAIDQARHSVRLLSYIFDASPVAQRFVDALGRACARGVDVRLLVDDAGSPDTALDRRCQEQGVRIERFLPVRVSRRIDQLNLRNHRKVLVVDGEQAFTGGLNVHRGHVLGDGPDWPVRDTHFGFRGPVVAHFSEVFADDWHFTTGQRELASVRDCEPEPCGSVRARGLAEGPDETLDRVRLTLLGALACARQRVVIVTPYFLPDQSLVTAIRVAALRGTRVDVLLPDRSDVRIVDYASLAQVGQVLGENVRVWQSPLPFDHSKIMLVDDCWSFLGSANWDPRSLRLNFEFNVECYDADLARQLLQLVEGRIAESRRLTPERLSALPLASRLRNGICRLLMPYI